MTATQLMVAFEGDGAGSGELSWGQLENWSAIVRLRSWLPLGGIKPLPPGTTVDEIAGELRYLMSRYQPMRTRLHFGPDGQPVQVVHASGSIPLEIIEGESAEDTCERYRSSSLDFTNEWPLRMAVIRHDGELTHMVVLASHFVTDAAGAVVMMREVAAMESAPVTGMQPLEQARWQRSAAGQRQHAAAARHWESILRSIPLRRFATPAVKPHPRYRRGQLDSPSLAGSVQRLASGADSSAVLLTLFSLALHEVCGADPVVVRPLVGNRFRPGLAGVVCTAAQAGLCVLDVAGLPWAEALAVVSKASMTAYKHAYFDPAAMALLHEEVSRARGETVDIACFFNDRRTGVASACAGASRFEWILERDSPPLEQLIVDVEDLPHGLRLTIHMDAHAVSPADGERLLRTMERLAADYANDGTADPQRAVQGRGAPAAAVAQRPAGTV